MKKAEKPTKAYDWLRNSLGLGGNKMIVEVKPTFETHEVLDLLEQYGAYRSRLGRKAPKIELSGAEQLAVFFAYECLWLAMKKFLKSRAKDRELSAAIIRDRLKSLQSVMKKIGMEVEFKEFPKLSIDSK